MNKLSVLFIMLLVLGIGFVSAEACYEYAYTSNSNSTDYTSISSSYVNTTVMGDDMLWTGWSFFTPRLNFTRNVTDAFTGGNLTVYSYFMWKTPINFSSSLVVRNSTVTIGSGNYSLRNISATQWVLNWTQNNYTGQNITVYFNRTFVKNVDNITGSPSDIYIGATKSYFLVENTIVDYGDDKEFQFTLPSPDQLGQFINVSDWAVGWTYTNRTCLTTCENEESTLINFFNVIIVLIGIFLILAGLYLFKEGILQNEAIIYYVVGLIIWFVFMPIIMRLITDIGC